MRLLALVVPSFFLACTSGEKPDSNTTATTGTQVTDDTGTQAGAPDISVDQTALDLGYLAPGAMGSGTVVVSNNGNAALDFSTSVSAGYTVNFPSGSVAAAANTSLVVSFSSSDLGSYPGTLTISSNDADTPSINVSLTVTVDTDTDGDGSPDSVDCQPFDPEIYPENTEVWYDGIDQNCDGKDDDQDGDGYGIATDCDDLEAAAHPGGTEIWYNGIDEDCDGNDADQDKDGVDYPLDCDDHNAAVSPNTVEIWYDGVDQNCDGNDADQDGDGSNYPADCNDINSAVYPGAVETCNGVDDDCNGVVDDATVGATVWYADSDLDGYGNPNSTTQACNQPPGYVSNSDDCDDVHGSISPAATEVCDSLDNDCDGQVDDNPTNGTTYYPDNDGDGYGSSSSSVQACSATAGLTTDHSDCDDNDAAINPAATEITGNGKDDNCDGIADQLPVATASGWTVIGTSSSQAIGAQGVLVTDDKNGDGDGELAISAIGDDTNGTDAGAIGFHDYGVMAAKANFSAGYLLLTGPGAGDYFGTSPLLLGDLDSDGYEEFLAGAPGDDTENTDAGAVYVFDLNGHTGTVDVSSIADATITSSRGYWGTSIAVGDFGGDGLLDLVSGAPYYSNNGNYYGRILLYDSSYTDWWSGTWVRDDAYGYIYGAGGGDYFGTSMVVADFNDDGYSDTVACSPFRSSSKGSCYFIDGQNIYYTGYSYAVNWTSSAEFQGAASSDYLGYSQTAIAAGDVNGDGIPDLAIGAPGYDGNVASGGGVMVQFGGTTWSGTITPTSADYLIQGDGASGTGIAMPGDVTQDGVGDLLVGSPGTGSGVVYLVTGGSLSGSTSLPTGAFASWTGETSGDYFGAAIGGYADLDGDGNGDLAAVSSKAANGATTNAGKVYVFKGY